jgi:hypothetical protein
MPFSGSFPQLTCRLMPRPVDHPHLSPGINLYEATLSNMMIQKDFYEMLRKNKKKASVSERIYGALEGTLLYTSFWQCFNIFTSICVF